MSFSYTYDELDHLQNLKFGVYMSGAVHPSMITPEYFRYLAKITREEPPSNYPMHEGMHPDDMDPIPTVEDYEEMADAIECNMQRGETL